MSVVMLIIFYRVITKSPLRLFGVMGQYFRLGFSGAYAHILGIQGLPTNPLILHVGLHNTYMSDYVEVGLTESSNNMPSGLVPDQWRDIWWNLMSLNDAQAALDDYNTVTSYTPEQGESKAHTYHWINTFNTLGFDGDRFRHYNR